MADEHDDIEPTQEPSSGEHEHVHGESHGRKEEIRDGVAHVWGLAVELGSILAGQAGEVVQAERELAEGEAEEFIDRIDGEG